MLGETTGKLLDLRAPKFSSGRFLAADLRTARGFLCCYPGIIVQGPGSVLLNFTDTVSPSTYKDVPHFSVCADTFHGGK